MPERNKENQKRENPQNIRKAKNKTNKSIKVTAHNSLGE